MLPLFVYDKIFTNGGNNMNDEENVADSVMEILENLEEQQNELTSK